MRRSSPLAAALFLAAVAHGAPAANFTVAAYLPEWRYDGANYERICGVVTHLIFFSIEVQPDGTLGALDRVPRKSLREEARRHCHKILICVGGNGRSAGFSSAVSSRSTRQRFVTALLRLCKKAGFGGVDFNWEYPGYFGGGYQADDAVAEDYRGLNALLLETRAAFAPSGRVVTLAYYPDGRQERMLAPMAQHVDAMHVMAYDQGGNHSTYEFAQQVAAQAAELLPPAKVTLGLLVYNITILVL